MIMTITPNCVNFVLILHCNAFFGSVPKTFLFLNLLEEILLMRRPNDPAFLQL